MALESARGFWKKMNEDREFQAKFEAAKDHEERAKMAEDAGFKFTMEEMKQVIQESTGKVLTDEELDNVSGGVVPLIVSICCFTGAGAAAAAAVTIVVMSERK